MERSSVSEYEVVILAPFGRDAQAAAEVLKQEGIASFPVNTVEELCERIKAPAGVLLVAEESLNAEGSEELRAVLSRQENWSNISIVLMTSPKKRFFTTENILEVFGMSGSITLLERPFRIMTLVSSVRAALLARKRQYQVRDLLDAQKFALAQRDDFLSIASHELKTPITSLMLQVQIRKRFMKRGDQAYMSQEKVHGFMNFTETQIKRLSRLVDDMLDISRIVNGKLSLNCEHVELGSLVEEALEGFLSQFQAAGCSVEWNVEDGVFGNWDRYRIEQVAANLFTNTIKYGAGRPVSITVKSEGDRALLLVQDNGMGIAAENQERIFQRFERAVIGNGISGLGLGLYITRQILDLHNGSIHVESAVGKGSTFVVDLPRS